MKKLSKLLLLLLIISMIVGCFASCNQDDEPENDESSNVDNGNQNDDSQNPGNNNGDNSGGNSGTEGGDNSGDNSGTEGGDNSGDNSGNGGNTTPEFIDYASQVKFNKNSGKAYAELEPSDIKSFVDGDTTHFYVDKSISSSGFLKARYLGINTPESTGIVEPWGKKASNYTKTQLSKATAIIIESDTSTWNIDSTGDRYLVWVWYKTAEDTDYRNLNIEILQQGLAFGSNAASNTYSDYTMGALNQAKAMKLHVFSSVQDPDFYYGGAIEITLEELKLNTEKYKDKLVRFEAVVAKTESSNVYVEEYDAENDMYFGMQLYCGYNNPVMPIMKIGNRVAVVGTVQYYEAGGYYQVSNIQYSMMRPDDKQYSNLLSEGHSASFNEVDAGDIMNGSITLDVIVENQNENGEVISTTVEKKTFDYGELAHFSTVTLKNLTVEDVYKTKNEESKAYGALTITCKDENGVTIKIRTYDKLQWEVGGEKVDVIESDFEGKVIASVKGIIDSYDGEYQVKIFDMKDVVFEQ